MLWCQSNRLFIILVAAAVRARQAGHEGGHHKDAKEALAAKQGSWPGRQCRFRQKEDK